jgi:hypothetical protein
MPRKKRRKTKQSQIGKQIAILMMRHLRAMTVDLSVLQVWPPVRRLAQNG